MRSMILNEQVLFFLQYTMVPSHHLVLNYEPLCVFNNVETSNYEVCVIISRVCVCVCVCVCV